MTNNHAERFLRRTKALRASLLVVLQHVDELSKVADELRATRQGSQTTTDEPTQQFNTTQSIGRLTPNILLSFAQFEREIISEPTRDKIAASKRKGKWFGGKSILGCDLAPRPAGRNKLVVNAAEAALVREVWHACPSGSLPAEQIERLVVDRIKHIGSDAALVAATFRRVQSGIRSRSAQIDKDHAASTREIQKFEGDIRKAAMTAGTDANVAARLATSTNAWRRPASGREFFAPMRGHPQS